MNNLLRKLLTGNLTVEHSESEECFVIQNKDQHALIAEVSYFDESAHSLDEAQAIAEALALVPELVKVISVIDASLRLGHLTQGKVTAEQIDLLLANTELILKKFEPKSNG